MMASGDCVLTRNRSETPPCSKSTQSAVMNIASTSSGRSFCSKNIHHQSQSVEKGTMRFKHDLFISL